MAIKWCHLLILRIYLHVHISLVEWQDTVNSAQKTKSTQSGEITLSFTDVVKSCSIRQFLTSQIIRESLPQFENRIMARVYVRSITRSTMCQKAPFC